MHSSTQAASQEDSQQKGSISQTQVSQPHPPQPGVSLLLHPSQEPQSAPQVLQSSPAEAWQRPSPQLLGQMPQSEGQDVQVSPTSGLQAPSPHTGGQGPQSEGQLLQVSPGLQ